MTTPTSKTSIALSTIYTPPPSCNGIVTYDGTMLWQNGINQTGDAACYPPRFSNIYDSAYSPGVCPQSWESVGSQSNPPGTFGAYCCPTGYLVSRTSNAAKLNNFCFSLMTAPLTNVYSVASLTNGSASPNPQLTTLSTDEVSSTTVYADVIRILWQSTNTGVIGLMEQTAAGSSGSVPTPGSTPPSMLAATFSAAAPSAPSSTPSGGLSTGAEVGIGIGVAIAAMAIAALAAVLLISRRHRRRDEPRRDTLAQVTKNSKLQELHADYPGPPTFVEMDARPVIELPGTETSSELEGRTLSEKWKAGEYFS